MSDPFGDRPFPRGALIAVVGLIVFTLVAVGTARWVGGTGTEPVTGSITESRELRFEDGRGGLVYVYAGTDESAIAVLEPGTENFIRGVLRGLARERRSHGIATLRDHPLRRRSAAAEGSIDGSANRPEGLRSDQRRVVRALPRRDTRSPAKPYGHPGRAQPGEQRAPVAVIGLLQALRRESAQA
jgi:putative photosynthetic complex assembly protein